MFERYADNAMEVMQVADRECETDGGAHIRQTHILLGLLRTADTAASVALEKHGVTYDRLRGVMSGLPVQTVDAEPTDTADGEGMMHTLTTGAQHALELALREALQMGHNVISPGHILLGITRQGDGPGVIALGRLDVDLIEVNQLVRSLMRGEEVEAVAQAADARLLTAFLYVLMRDHLPLGVVEGIVRDHIEVVERRGIETFRFSNAQLAEYAGQIADRLLLS